MKKFTYLAIITSLSLSYGGEYDDLFDSVEEVEAISENSEKSPITFSGEHKVEIAQPIATNDTLYNSFMKSPKSINTFTLEYKKDIVTSKFSVKTVVQVDDNTEMKCIPEENYISLNFDKVKLTTGFQIFSWGTADAINPTDNINSRDYTVSTSGEKLSLFSLRTEYYPTTNMAIDALWAPRKSGDIAPTYSDISSSSFDFEYTLKNQDLSYSSSIAGVRSKFFLGNREFSLSYLYDYDKVYTPTLKSDVVLNLATQQISKISVEIERERVHRVGADFKTTASIFGIWAEGVYNIRGNKKDDYSKYRDNVEATIGFDFNYGSTDQNYANIQIFGSHIIEYDSERFDEYTNNQPAITPEIGGAIMQGDNSYMNNYFYRQALPLISMQNEESYLGFAINNDFDFPSLNLKQSTQLSYINPMGYDENIERLGELIGGLSFKYTPQDALTITLGGEGFYSAIKENDTIKNSMANKVGLFYNESRIYLNATYNWSI